MKPLWDEALFKESALIVFGFMALLGIIVFPLQKRHPGFRAAWISLQSWLLAAPLLFLFVGLGGPWPLVFFTALSILGAKEFFQITGIYHRSAFVWTTYLGILGLAASIYYDNHRLYDAMPMIVLALACMVPLLQNAFKNMLQFISLSLINFIFLGWGFLHLGWIATMENGPYFLLYIILVTEMSDNFALAAGRFFGKKKLVSNITAKRTAEGLMLSLILTLALAYGMRHLLPDRSLPYWLIPAFLAFLAGSLGDLVISVIRRDLGLKEMGAFILARGGVLSVVDRAIFVAPIFYYALEYLRMNPP